MKEASTSPDAESRPVAWDRRGQVATFCAAAVAVIACFVVVYYGCDCVTGLRQDRVRLDFAFEQQLPFVPELTLVYTSLFLMFPALPWVLRDHREIRRLASLMIGVTLIAGCFFLMLPAELHFDHGSDLGRFQAAFEFADALNLTYNLCPSLHVAYAVLCASVVQHRNRSLGLAYHAWALAIAIAAWLTHQHHLMDLIGGYALGRGGAWWADRNDQTSHT